MELGALWDSPKMVLDAARLEAALSRLGMLDTGGRVKSQRLTAGASMETYRIIIPDGLKICLRRQPDTFRGDGDELSKCCRIHRKRAG